MSVLSLIASIRVSKLVAHSMHHATTDKHGFKKAIKQMVEDFNDRAEMLSPQSVFICVHLWSHYVSVSLSKLLFL